MSTLLYLPCTCGKCKFCVFRYSYTLVRTVSNYLSPAEILESSDDEDDENDETEEPEPLVPLSKPLDLKRLKHPVEWEWFTFRRKRRGVTSQNRPLGSAKYRPSPRACMYDMPLELLSNVFRYLKTEKYDESRNNLVAAARSCRLWKDQALRWVWIDLHIESPAVARRMLESGGLGRYPTTKLVLSGWIEKPDNKCHETQWCRDFTFILMMCPKIIDLHLLWLKDVPVSIFEVVPLPELERLAICADFVEDPFLIGRGHRNPPRARSHHKERMLKTTKRDFLLRPSRTVRQPIYLPTSFSRLDLTLSGAEVEARAIKSLVNSRLAGSSMGMTLELEMLESSNCSLLHELTPLSSITDHIIIFGSDLSVPDTLPLLSKSPLRHLELRDLNPFQIRQILAVVDFRELRFLKVDLNDSDEMISEKMISILHKTLDFVYLDRVTFDDCSKQRFLKVEGGTFLVETLEKTGVTVRFQEYLKEGEAADGAK